MSWRSQIERSSKAHFTSENQRESWSAAAKRMCFLILEDESGRLPTAMAPPVYEQFERELLELGLREPGLLVEGRLEAPPEEKRNAVSGGGRTGVYRSVLIDKIWSLDALCQIRSVHGAVGHPGQSPRVAPQVVAAVSWICGSKPKRLEI